MDITNLPVPDLTKEIATQIAQGSKDVFAVAKTAVIEDMRDMSQRAWEQFTTSGQIADWLKRNKTIVYVVAGALMLLVLLSVASGRKRR